MSVPKSVTRYSKNGITYVSSVDRVNYTMEELTRGALRDVGKHLLRKFNSKLMKLPGMKNNPRARGKNSPFQYWVRKKECDLQVGTKMFQWYGYRQELGTSGMKKLGIMRTTTEEEIPTIIEIESQYLSALEDEAKALTMIDEEETEGVADD